MWEVDNANVPAPTLGPNESVIQTGDMSMRTLFEDYTGLFWTRPGLAIVLTIAILSLAGIPLTELVAMGHLSQDKLDEICHRTANGGAEITKLVGTSAWYAPSAGTVEMVESIIRDKKRVIACAAYCEDQFGVAPGQAPV
jgi:malate dehydrogenase